MNNTQIKIIAETAALTAFMSLAGLPVLLALFIYTATRLCGHYAEKLFVEAEIIKGEYHEH